MAQHWNHRTIQHVNTDAVEERSYLTVHEVHYNEDGTPSLVNMNAASPRSKKECGWIKRAFDYPSVAWVDDSTFYLDGACSYCYREWGWLVENGDS